MRTALRHAAAGLLVLLALAGRQASGHAGLPAGPKYHFRELKFGCLNTTVGAPFEDYNTEHGHLRCPDSAKITEYKDHADVTHRIIKHAPLKGVTKDMLHWFFGLNFPRFINYKGKLMNWYHVWHPVDHIASPITLLPGVNPSPLWVKLPAPGVFIMEHYRSLDAAHGGSDHEWKKGYPFFHDMQIRNPILDQFVRNDRLVVDLTLPGPLGPITISTLSHFWYDSPEGLQLTIELTSGVVPFQGLNPPYLISTLSNVVLTQALLDLFLYDLGNAFTRHTVEEFGNLQHFLPAVWEQQGPGKLPAALRHLVG